MMDGGVLWFTDLTVADPTYALPVLTSLTFLATVELGAADGMQGQSADMLKNLKNFMRGLAVVMVPFTASLPAVRVPLASSDSHSGAKFAPIATLRSAAFWSLG